MSLARSVKQYLGVRAIAPPDLQIATRDPTSADKAYVIGNLWLNKTGSNVFMWPGSGSWISLSGGGSGIITLTGNTGGAVGASAGNVTLVGSGGVTVTGSPGSNTLTITGSSSSISWTDKATSFAAASGNGYFVTASATATLPASPTQGDVINISAQTASVVIIQAAAGQTIRLANSTSGVAGSAESTDIGCTLQLVYRSANTQWVSIGSEGSWTLI